MHPKKIERFTKAVQYYLMTHNLDDVDYQIDLALVYINTASKQGKVILMESVV